MTSAGCSTLNLLCIFRTPFYRNTFKDLSVYYTKLIIPNIKYHLVQKNFADDHTDYRWSHSPSLYSPSSLYPYSGQKPLFRSQLLKFRAGECHKNKLLDKLLNKLLSVFFFFIVYRSRYFEIHLILADLINKYSKGKVKFGLISPHSRNLAG